MVEGPSRCDCSANLDLTEKENGGKQGHAYWMLRTFWDQRFGKAGHLAKLAEVEAAALPCWPYASANAAGDPSGCMGVELCPAEAGLDVFGFDCRDVIIEGPIPSSLEEGSDDDEAADGDR